MFNGTRIKILILEDNLSDVCLVEYELKKSGLNFISQVVQNRIGFEDALLNFGPDIILSDYSLPAFNGKQAFALKQKISPYTPFIIVSGTIGDENSVDLIKSGVTDYVLKSKLFGLSPKINRALKDLEKAREKLIADRNLYKAKNLYAFISQVNQNIVRVKDEATLFLNSCHLAIDFGQFKMAWVGMFDFEHNTVSLVEHCGIPAEDVSLFTNYAYQNNEVQDQVLKKGELFVCNDIKNDPELKDLKLYALKRGLNSCVVLPIKKSGVVIGTFNLYSTELDFLGEEEIKLLLEVTNDISFALDVFEKDEKQKEAAKQIVKNEKQKIFDDNNLNALINNTRDLMWSVDREYNLITSNKPFDEMAQMNFGKVIQKGSNVLSVAFLPEMQMEFKRSYDRTFGGESFTEVTYLDRPVETWAEISYCPIQKEHQVIGAACFSRDITERKRTEIEREKMLANIIQHSKNLEQFAQIVSHNLRGPVASILGISNILKNDISNEDRELSQNFLFGSAEQLDVILKDLNNILQVRSEINEFKEPVYFDELVTSIRSCFHFTVEKETAQIITDFSALEKIITIKSYIYSIFYNLISNSIKYRKPGIIPEIMIKAEVIDQRAKIIFEDNGMGIDLIKHGDQVFGLYKRFHFNIEGRGLGLFMVKTQVETLGGSIVVESRINEGAKFIIDLPLLPC
jgi:PAS domain S-box-containing protein